MEALAPKLAVVSLKRTLNIYEVGTTRIILLEP